jgi:ribosomal protein S18 acetylase RimI-like enzyme
MIRAAIPEDTTSLLEIANATTVFKPNEIVALREVLEDYHKGLSGHRTYVHEDEGRLLGFVYFAPAAMTDQTWYIFWIFVDKEFQAQGIGGNLLRLAEREAKGAGGRLMLIETSGLSKYARTREFYQRHGYTLDAIVHDYYEDGDDMHIFRKRLVDGGESNATQGRSR